MYQKHCSFTLAVLGASMGGTDIHAFGEKTLGESRSSTEMHIFLQQRAPYSN